MILALGDMEKIIKISTDNKTLSEYVTDGLNLLNNEHYDYSS